jgi:hypothetical protein
MAVKIIHSCSYRKVKDIFNTVHYSALNSYDLPECAVKVFQLYKTRSGKVHCQKPEEMQENVKTTRRPSSFTSHLPTVTSHTFHHPSLPL